MTFPRLTDDAVNDMRLALDAIREVIADYQTLIERALEPAPVTRAPLPPVEDYNVIRAEFTDRLFDAFISYLSSGGAMTRFRNAARRALVEAIPAAFYSGYSETAGTDAETTPEDERFVTKTVKEQMDYMDGAFEGLKDWRAEEDFTESDVTARVEAWGRMLDSVYAEGKMLGKKNQMLTWRLGETEQHCKDCTKLDGKRHSAKWYIGRDFIPGKPGAAMECKGFKCQCRFEDDDGNMVTVEAQ